LRNALAAALVLAIAWGCSSPGAAPSDAGPGPYLRDGQESPEVQPPGHLSAQAISVGVGAVTSSGTSPHVCALVAGGVVCGDGVTAPVPVPGISGATAVSSGGYGMVSKLPAQVDCAITTGGGVSCWGLNSHGELGNGSRDLSEVPVAVPGLSGVTSLSVAHGFQGGTVCAVAGGGHVWCWGYVGMGGMLLQTGTAALFVTTPVPITGFTGTPSAVSVGVDAACVVTTAGGVECWGDNSFGQLGDGTTAPSEIPVQVTGLTSGATAVSAGYGYACAIVNGGVACWGDDGFTSSRAPAPVPGLASGVSGLSVGGAGQAACAVVNGGVQCWGKDGADGGSANPGAISGLPAGIQAVSAGYGPFACALGMTGDVWCWGGAGGGPAVPQQLPAPLAGGGPTDAGSDSGCDPEPSFDQTGVCVSGTQSGVITSTTGLSGRIGVPGPALTTVTATFPGMSGDFYVLNVLLDDWGGSITSGQTMAYPLLDFIETGGQISLALTSDVPDGCVPGEYIPHSPFQPCPGPYPNATANAQIGNLDCTLHGQTRLACSFLVTRWDMSGGSSSVLGESRGWIHLDVTNPSANDP
jgi:hypothetical protein